LLENNFNTEESYQIELETTEKSFNVNYYNKVELSEQVKQKWLKLPNDIWFYVLNEFFDDEIERTNHLLKLSQVSKIFYKQLLSSELIMNNFTFSLKKGVKLSDIVNKHQPSYKIGNLSLMHVKDEIKNEDMKYLQNAKFFNLHKLDISFCSHLNDESFQYFQNVKVLEMVRCNQNTITNQGLLKLNHLRVLIMIACDQKTITSEAFQFMNTDKLRKLNISNCVQFTHKIFNHLSKNCKIKMNQLNLSRKNKRRLETRSNGSNKLLKV
jgi:hypothetical protein